MSPKQELYWSKLADNYHWGGRRRGNQKVWVTERAWLVFFFFPPLHLFFLQSCWISAGSSPSPGLELGAGWWLGGGHDLHVLGEDGLERLVPVDHGAKHQWLKETDACGYHHAAEQPRALVKSFLTKVLEVLLWGWIVSKLIIETHLKVLCVNLDVTNDFKVSKSLIYYPSMHYYYTIKVYICSTIQVIYMYVRVCVRAFSLPIKSHSYIHIPLYGKCF